MNKIVSPLLVMAISATVLTGCAPSAKHSPSSQRQTSSKKVSCESTRTTRSNKKAPVATFANNTLTSSTGTIKITGQRQVASAFPNHQQLLITYEYSNQSTKQQVPSDLWSKHFKATQDGKNLVSGSLSLSGQNSDSDNDDINNSVTPVDAGQHVTVAAMYKISPSAGPVTLTVHDGQKNIGTTTLTINGNE